jgi:hypothetical protein
MTWAWETIFGNLARHTAKGRSIGILTVTLGGSVTLFPGVAGGWNRWWAHISETSDDLSRLARNVFGQGLDLLSGDLRAGWRSSMTNRRCPLVDRLAELIENTRSVGLVQGLLPSLQSLDLGLDIKLISATVESTRNGTHLLLHGWSDFTSSPLVCSCSQTCQSSSGSSTNSLTSVDKRGDVGRRH